jgi:amidase
VSEGTNAGASILARDTLGAFCRHTHVALPGAPAGPLAGLSFGLKDLFDVAGHGTGFGSPDWLATHPPAEAHAAVLARLLGAGASLAGRTHTEEMAFSLTGENAHYGTPVNPAAPGRVPGGSSSGSASAVAGGLVAFAIGSDTGGSVRAPASYCGLYGIRPTHGAVSLAGACPLAPSFDTAGWFARDAATLSRVGDVLLPPAAGPQTPGRGLLAADAWALAAPAVVAALHPALAAVERVLGALVPVTVSDEGLRVWFELFRTLQFHEIWATHGPWVEAVRPRFGAQVGARFDAVRQVPTEAAEAARPRREAVTALMAARLAGNAVLVLPTMPDAAPRCGQDGGAVTAVRERAMQLLCISGLSGVPQVTLPLGRVAEGPVGVSLMAARGNDLMLLRLAEAVAAALGERTTLASPPAAAAPPGAAPPAAG